HAHQRREAPGRSPRHGTGAARGQPRAPVQQLDVYKVAGKVFLIVTDDPDERIVTLKAEPEYGRLLHEHPSITPGLPTKPSLPSTWRSSHPGVERPGRHASR